MARYPAILNKDPDSDYGVHFPDVPGCISAGSTFEEAAANAREALDGHLRWMQEDGDAVPQPSSADNVELEDGEHLFFVDIDLSGPPLAVVTWESDKNLPLG